MRWFSWDAGQGAKIETLLGYTNVRGYPLFHRDYLWKQRAQGCRRFCSFHLGRSRIRGARKIKIKATDYHGVRGER
jgi:hypothetical protein